MSKTKITVITMGHMPAEFNRQKVKNWASSIFEIIDEIESYALSKDSDGESWEFSDDLFENLLPNAFNGDFLIAIVNVPLELNWYSRRLSGNRVLFTFHDIKEMLKQSNIPIENIIFRLLYSYTLLYKRSGNRIPSVHENTNFTHDETRGCLFDMNGIKTDVIYSCHNPIICEECVARLKQERVSNEVISNSQNEIKGIQKILFYRIADYIKQHPLRSLAISSIAAVLLNMIASCIYDAIK